MIRQIVFILLTFAYTQIGYSISDNILMNNAGRDTSVLVCYDSGIIDATEFLSEDAQEGGRWSNDAFLFDSSTFNGRTFIYIVDDGISIPDSAFIIVRTRFNAGLSIDFNRVCIGDSILFNGEWYYEPGFYNDTIPYFGTDCDSIINRLAFFVYPEPEFVSLDTLLCEGDSLFFFDQWWSEDTVLDTVLLSENNCDSLIAFINIRIADQIDFEINGLDTICENESLMLSAFPYNYDYIWSNSATGNIIEINQPGEYQVTATQDIGCDLAKTFQVNSFDPIALSGQSFYQVYPDTVLSISIGIARDEASIQWQSPQIEIDCENCLTNEVFIQEDTNIEVTIEDNNGCVTIFPIVVEVIARPLSEDSIYIPNTFNPKSEQEQNRSFYIQSEGQRSYSMKIYDRWGNLVFSKKDLLTNSQNGSWDGSFKDVDLSSGVYLYQAIIEGEFFNGSVSLIR